MIITKLPQEQVVCGKMKKAINIHTEWQRDLTSRRDCSCHRSPPAGQLSACHPPPSFRWDWELRENAKRISFNKTYLVYQLHQATLHSSTGSMESLKHGPVLQTRIKLSSMKIWEDIINLGMFKARFELWEHLGEDGHVLLRYPQVPPHLRNLLWLHVCKRRHLSSLLTVLWQNMF